MHFSVSGSKFSAHLYEEIELLTGAANFLLPTFRYDAERGRVAFTIERFPFLKVRRPLFGFIQWGVYSTTGRVRTAVAVGGVAAVDFQRADWAPADADTFSIERGLALRDDHVGIDSVEEVSGKKAFRLTIKITGIDIRLEDLPAETAG
jgi:hypothetical protein